jgi:hypothetical protein
MEMTRIDNSDPEMIKLFDLEFDPTDPGRTEPVDLCRGCFRKLEDFESEHPSYEEQFPPYECFSCGEELTEEDD